MSNNLLEALMVIGSGAAESLARHKAATTQAQVAAIRSRAMVKAGKAMGVNLPKASMSRPTGRVRSKPGCTPCAAAGYVDKVRKMIAKGGF